jgi:hypothetical protein
MKKSGMAHDSTKGFRSTWDLNNDDQFVTVGFNPSKKREMSLWDLRKGLEQSMETFEIDDLPTLFWIFCDRGNNLIYLGGKGDNNLKFFELTKDAPMINYLGEFKSPHSQTGLSMIPQRFNNVEKCEIGVFMKLTGKEVQTISFTVPRKESNLNMKIDDKMVHIFQEDIYPPVASGKSTLSSEEWLKGFDYLPDEISLKKKGMVSIYDIPVEQGGKEKPEEDNLFMRSETEGFLFHVNEKDPEKKDKFWISIKNRSIMLNAYSRRSSKIFDPVPFSSVLAIHEAKFSENPEEENRGLQLCTKDKMYYFLCESQKNRDHWIQLINKNIKVYYQVILFLFLIERM